MSKSKIEWTDRVWNPVTGCTKISEGCKNCYAERQSKRFAGMNGYPADDPFKVTLHPDRLEEPLHWKKPSRIFVCSMGDLFHGDVTMGFISRVFSTIRRCPQHTFIVLTKRPVKMLHAVNDYVDGALPNLWLGVTAENQETADERIPLLLKTPAAVRFVSIEPMLGPVSFRWSAWDGLGTKKITDHLDGLRMLDWVICGGESGPGARPMHPDWARSLRDQCKEAAVPFFFKQWGEWGTRAFNMQTDEPVFRMFRDKQEWINHARTWINGGICIDTAGQILNCGGDFDTARYPVSILHKLGKKLTGHLLDGVEHREFPK